MSVLVTGATGRLGQRLVARLLAGQKAVAILTRRPFLAAAMYGNRIPIHEWHPFTEDVPAEAVSGTTAVAHLGAEPWSGRSTAHKRERLHASRLTTTAKLLAAFGTRPVRIVTVSVPNIGHGQGSAPIDETVPRPATSRTRLEAVARAHEEAAMAGRSASTSLAIVRLGLLLGAEPPFPALDRLARRRVGLDLYDSLIPVIDVEDAAALVAGLLEHAQLEGPVNGVAPEPLRGEDLMRLVAEASGARPRVLLPRGFARSVAGELSPLLLNRACIVPRRLLEAGAIFMHPDPKVSLARTLMGKSAAFQGGA
jgi:hypothetical protein